MKTLIRNTILLLVCSMFFNNINSQPPTFTDPRDDQEYPLVLIGNQLWTKENMNLVTPNGSCYYNDDLIVTEYWGRLYNWEAAPNVCPDGYRLPSNDDWNDLVTYLKWIPHKLTPGYEGGKFKNICGISTYGGYKHNNTYYNLTNAGYFWTSTVLDSESIIGRIVSYNIDQSIFDPQEDYLSVRCIYDGEIDVEEIEEMVYPEIIINKIESIQPTSFICSAELKSYGSIPITEMGLCWSLGPDPTITESDHTPVLDLNESFALPIEELEPYRLYYVRAYVICHYGTIFYSTTYSDQKAVRTFPDPAPTPIEDYVIDIRDGHFYTFDTIGNQIWLKQDIKYYVDGSCLSCVWEGTPYTPLDTVSCQHDYGRLYNWPAAMNIDQSYTHPESLFVATYPHQGVCPSGWHIPSYDEWAEFEQFVENSPEMEELLSEFNPTPDLGHGYGYCYHYMGNYISSTLIQRGTHDGNPTYYFYGCRFTLGDDPVKVESSGPRSYKYALRCLKNDDDVDLPIIELGPVIPSDNTATASIYLVNEGNSPVNTVVLLWSESPNPTLNNSNTFKSTESISEIPSKVYTMPLSNFQTGSFDIPISGLHSCKTYYLRVCAINNSGLSYSNEVMFETPYASDPNYGNSITINAPIDPVDINSTIYVSAELNNEDVIEATWNWGDGESSDGIINENIIGEHNYSLPGVYVLNLTVKNSCGDIANLSYQYIVGYDPQDGFVTGGGWINSPVGAYTPDPLLEGKANFGFVSKYKKGSNIPEGNTEFQFKAGDLNFNSSLYDWLVIAGAKAMFKGEGTINQSGEYGFMLSAIDEDLKNSADKDKFRIKIWDKNDEDALIYDNEMGTDDYGDATTQIAGGSIVIHKSKDKGTIEPRVITEMDDHEFYFNMFPNPTNNSTVINLMFPTDEQVTLMLLNLNGSVIENLYQGECEKGIEYMIDINTENELTQGMYMIKLITQSGKLLVKRLVVIQI